MLRPLLGGFIWRICNRTGSCMPLFVGWVLQLRIHLTFSPSTEPRLPVRAGQRDTLQQITLPGSHRRRESLPKRRESSVQPALTQRQPGPGNESAAEAEGWLIQTGDLSFRDAR